MENPLGSMTETESGIGSPSGTLTGRGMSSKMLIGNEAQAGSGRDICMGTGSDFGSGRNLGIWALTLTSIQT